MLTINFVVSDVFLICLLTHVALILNLSAAQAANKQTSKPGNYPNITEVVSFLRSDADLVQPASTLSVLYI